MTFSSLQAIANLEKQLDSLKRMASVSVAQQAIASPIPPAQQSPTPSTSSLTNQQEMLLGLYDEFVKTDEGKALSANLQRFARYVQGRTSKPAE